MPALKVEGRVASWAARGPGAPWPVVREPVLNAVCLVQCVNNFLGSRQAKRRIGGCEKARRETLRVRRDRPSAGERTLVPRADGGHWTRPVGACAQASDGRRQGRTRPPPAASRAGPTSPGCGHCALGFSFLGPGDTPAKVSPEWQNAGARGSRGCRGTREPGTCPAGRSGMAGERRKVPRAPDRRPGASQGGQSTELQSCQDASFGGLRAGKALPVPRSTLPASPTPSWTSQGKVLHTLGGHVPAVRLGSQIPVPPPFDTERWSVRGVAGGHARQAVCLCGACFRSWWPATA